MNLKTYLQGQGHGSVAALATAIGGNSPDVSSWAGGKKPIPAHFCPSIVRETGGAVTLRDLRPNDWQKYWPELAAKKVA